MRAVMTVKELSPGALFRFAAIDWVLLDQAEGKSLCLMATQMGPHDFDAQGNSDYIRSSLRSWLEQHFLKILLVNGARRDDLLPLLLDMGNEKIVTAQSGVGILSFRQCRKYVEFIPRTKDWYWTLTQSDGIYGPGLKCAAGDPCGGYAYYGPHSGGVFVRPAICLRPDAFVTDV